MIPHKVTYTIWGKSPNPVVNTDKKVLVGLQRLHSTHGYLKYGHKPN